MYKSITFLVFTRKIPKNREQSKFFLNSFCLSFTFSEVKPKSPGSKGQTQIHW